MNNYCYGDKVLIKSKGVCNGLIGTIVGIWNEYRYKNCFKVKVKHPLVNTTVCVRGDHLQKLEGENTMTSKLTGYKQVAEIKQMGKSYYYAIYDDGRRYSPGDEVLVSGAARGKIQTIESILDLEEALSRMGNKNITAEIISYVDTSAYDERVKRREEAEKLKKDMDKVIKQMEENNKYEMYAEKNPELKEMFNAYKALIEKC